MIISLCIERCTILCEEWQSPLFVFKGIMSLNHLTKLISEKVESFGYSLISISERIEKGERIVSIILDRVEPINMDDIVDISNKLNEYIDTIDDSESSYTLDISSLGAEKPLKIEELDKYLNRFVHIHLINPIEGENIYEGDLSDVKKDMITLSYRLKTRIKTVDIKKENISKARLAIKF